MGFLNFQIKFPGANGVSDAIVPFELKQKPLLRRHAMIF